MTPQEAHRKIADVMDMCEGTLVSWYKCFKSNAITLTIQEALELGYAEAAIAIVEDKPVFIGDELYLGIYNKTVKIVYKHDEYEGLIYNNLNSFGNAGIENFSWLPPAATVMVELTVDQAELGAKLGLTTDIAKACREALAKLER